jgi:hypothetical protein
MLMAKTKNKKVCIFLFLLLKLHSFSNALQGDWSGVAHQAVVILLFAE